LGEVATTPQGEETEGALVDGVPTRVRERQDWGSQNLRPSIATLYVVARAAVVDIDSVR